MNVHYWTTPMLQRIAVEQIERLDDKGCPGNAALAQECLDEVVRRLSIAWRPGYVGPSPERPVMGAIPRALRVIVHDPKIRAWLAINDPKALAQAQEALSGVPIKVETLN